MTMAQFSRDDILLYRGLEQGLERGLEQDLSVGSNRGLSVEYVVLSLIKSRTACQNT